MSQQLLGVLANSGSAKDIQIAVDEAFAQGIQNVIIPGGVFNFVEAGEPWMTVEIPAGVNIFGALTDRDAYGQVVEWKTILVMPYEVTEGYHTSFFKTSANQNFRFSDIKLVGYREIDPNSDTRYFGIEVFHCKDFRVDHSSFRNLAGCGVEAIGSCGVVDHDRFVNSVGHVEDAYNNCTVWYGVNVSRGSEIQDWEADVTKVFGHYTGYTVFVEDCYFEKWRHCTVGNYGAHVVTRHNKVKDVFAYAVIDAHGYGYIKGDGTVSRGTRAMEIYDNQFLNPIQWANAIWIRGGAAIIFNNVAEGFSQFLFMSQEASDEVPECQVHDVWIWNNNIGDATVSEWHGDKNPIVENADYFRHAPGTFDYVPYQYPHPLTELTPTLPIDLPVIAAGALVTVDAALVAIYLATVFGLI
jgi:hypothetical protein